MLTGWTGRRPRRCCSRRGHPLALIELSVSGKLASPDTAGDRAVDRNGHAAATAAYQRAAQLSEDATAATRRLAQAAEAALDDGQHQAARDLAGRAGQNAALTVRLLRVRALADIADGIMLGSYELNLAGAAAIAGSDPAQSLWMLMEAHQEIRQAPYDHDRIAATVRALDGLPSDYGQQPLGWLIRWNAASVLGLDTTRYPPLGTRSPGYGITPSAWVRAN